MVSNDVACHGKKLKAAEDREPNLITPPRPPIQATSCVTGRLRAWQAQPFNAAAPGYVGRADEPSARRPGMGRSAAHPATTTINSMTALWVYLLGALTSPSNGK